jgi:hypothetical protein
VRAGVGVEGRKEGRQLNSPPPFHEPYHHHHHHHHHHHYHHHHHHQVIKPKPKNKPTTLARTWGFLAVKMA